MIDGTGQIAHVEAGFVTGRADDGRPLVSHGWARTIDGVQGGTWDQVYLPLDRYRRYVGQSRSIAPTHIWNTTRQSLDDGDHGGRLVNEPRGTPAEQIASALARAQPKPSQQWTTATASPPICAQTFNTLRYRNSARTAPVGGSS